MNILTRQTASVLVFLGIFLATLVFIRVTHAMPCRAPADGALPEEKLIVRVLNVLLPVAYACSGSSGGSGTPATPAPLARLEFTLPAKNGTSATPGTLKAIATDGTVIGTWSAGAGDNDPTHQNQQNIGPIPSGTWNVHRQGFNTNHPSWYQLDAVTYTGSRFGFFIHGYGVTEGCIILASGAFDGFAASVNARWPSNQNTIQLIVRY